jgi:hypothetical protein
MERQVIIVADKSKLRAGELRPCPGEQELSLVPCETAEEIIELLDVLPLCGAKVPLVVIEPEILKDATEDSVTNLSKCAPDVPFTLLPEANLTADVAEKFEQICSHREQLKPDENWLIDMLKKVGVEIAYPRK